MADNTTTFILNARDNTSGAFSSLQSRLTGLNAAATSLHTSFMRPLKLAGLDNVTGGLAGLKNTMASMPVAGTLLAAGGVAAATKGLLDNSIAAHSAMGAIQDLSTKYKISTDALQVFGEMGADAGVSTETIAKGFGKLQIKVAEAMQGSKEAIQGFQDVGLTPKDLEGGAVSVFKKISDLYKTKDFASADPFKIATAKDLLGKAGMELIPVLEQGGAKYDEILGKMTKEGRFFSSDTIKQADEVSDAWDASMRRIDGLKKTVGFAMAPMLTAITDGITKLLDSPAKGEIIDTFKKLGETIASEAPKFIAKIPDIVNGFSMVFNGIKRIADLVGWDTIIGKVIFMLASPFIAATISLALSIGRLALATGGFVGKLALLAGGGIMTAVRGLMGLQIAFTQVGLTAGVAWAAVIAPIVIVGAAVVGLAYLVYSNWGGIKAFAGGMFDGFLASMTPVKAAFEPLFTLFGVLWTSIKSVFGITDQSTQSWGAWAEAGKVAGSVLGAAFKLLLTPLTLIIDAIKLIGASWAAIQGKGFNFESSTAKMYAPMQSVAQGVTPTGITPQLNLGATKQGQAFTPQLNLGQNIAPARAQFDGKLNININQQGKAEVERVDSSQGFDITTRAGFMGA